MWYDSVTAVLLAIIRSAFRYFAIVLCLFFSFFLHRGRIIYAIEYNVLNMVRIVKCKFQRNLTVYCNLFIFCMHLRAGHFWVWGVSVVWGVVCSRKECERPMAPTNGAVYWYLIKKKMKSFVICVASCTPHALSLALLSIISHIMMRRTCEKGRGCVLICHI